MSDPISAVHESLQPLFLIATERNGKYTYSEVQVLKETINHYLEAPSKSSFIALKKAVRSSLSYIEKWQLDFEPIKESFDKEAQQHEMSPINWPRLLSGSNASPRFQFSALNHFHEEDELLVWLRLKANKANDSPFTSQELIRLLINNQHEHGFSKKLSQHLVQDPNFVVDLILKSDRNFLQIASSSLSLHLTDEQLATAIIKHAPDFNEEEPSITELNQYIEEINNRLSYGRSISTLLRNSHAKDILDRSVIFQLYQSDNFNHRSSAEPRFYLEERVSKHTF